MLDNEQLAEFFIFSEISKGEISELAQCGELLEFDTNEIIFREGENALNLYGVFDGEVELSILFKDKILKKDIQYEESIVTRIETLEKNIVIDTIKPGEIFGWSAFINPRLFTSTAKCAKPTRVFSLVATDLQVIFDKNPQVGYFFINRLAEIISKRLRDRTDKLIEIWSEAFEIGRIQE